MNESRLQKQVETIVQGARAILEKKNFKDAAKSIFDCCCQMTGAQSGYVALLSQDGYENEVLFLESGGLPCSVDPNLPMPIRGLREQAYNTSSVAYENDFMNSGWIEFLPAGHVAMSNVMFAPLNLDGKTVGIMGLANKPTDFTDEDAKIAAIFGDLAAIALKNSRHIDLLCEKTASLEMALSEIKTLKGIIPICMYCKGIRDDKGYWNQLEKYIIEHSEAQFSHGICEKCMEKHYSETDD